MMCLSNCTLGVYTEEPVATCSVINLQYARRRLYFYPPTNESKCHGAESNLQCDFNTTVTYRCADEYNLLGPSVTTCVAQNTWFPPTLGRCIHKSEFEECCLVMFNCMLGELRMLVLVCRETEVKKFNELANRITATAF